MFTPIGFLKVLRPLPFIHSMILLSTLVLTTWLLSHWIGFDPYLIMERVKGSFLLHALRALFRLFGLEMPILLLSLVALVGGCSSLHMDDNSAGGRAVDSGSGSDNWQKYLNLSEENDSAASASPPSSSFFRGLSDMFPAPDLGEEVQQVSPTHSISQTDLWNSPSSSAPTPGQDNQPPLIPELHPPLLDDDTRRAELASRLRTVLWGKAYREEMIDSVVDTQVQIEKHIQAALVGRDYSVESLLAKRHQIRGLIFSPMGEALSERTYALHLKEILQLGTVQSLPFRRVERAIKDFNLFLELERA